MSERSEFDPRVYQAMVAGVESGIRPRFQGGIWEWANAQRVPITSTQNTTYQGLRYNFDRFPVVASLMFGFFEDPTARELFAQKSVQTAFTTCAFFACGWQLTEGDAGNIIYVMHTRDAAREKMKDTLRPIFGGMKALGDVETKADTVSGGDAESTAEVLRFAGGALYVGGGQSVSVLTSTPARVVLLDEAERHGSMGGETTFGLARGRLTGADEGKLVAFSKPEKEAEFRQEEKTGRWKHRPKELALMDAEWVQGDQREFHCPCPHCGKWQPIRWEDIRYDHLNAADPGKPALWDWTRFEAEVHWQCPACSGKVHEGKEKEKMILAGARSGAAMCWRPRPQEERRQREAYPTGRPGKWSATVSALTDIAFASLRWGNLAVRWINAQGDSTQIVNFRKEILGQPERPLEISDTSVQHLRRLIVGIESTEPKPWRIGKERDRQRIMPVTMPDFAYLGMAVDRQREYLKFIVRAFGRDGRSYLMDYGTLPGLADVPTFLKTTKFFTTDGAEAMIKLCFVDLGGDDAAEAYDYCFYGWPLIVGCRGVGDDATGRLHSRSVGGYVWSAKRPNCPEREVEYWQFDSQYFERFLYIRTIQEFDPKRHRPWAPAIYFPCDVGDDYLRELTAMHEVERPIVKSKPNSPLRRMWEKKHSGMANDYGDCEKMLRVMDHVYGGRQIAPGLQPGGEDGSEKREYILK